jgi:hypothetical protein
MNDRPGSSRAGNDSDMAYDRESTDGTPRWVKVSGIVALLLALVVAVILLIGGGEHGPSRHGPSGGSDDQTPPARVTEGHQPPAGGHG